MKTLLISAFLTLAFSCSGPSFKSDKATLALARTEEFNVLYNLRVEDSTRDAERYEYLSQRIDTIDYQLIWINDKADTALIMVTNIDKKALRRYNAGHFFGGVADGLSGGRASDIARIFKGKRK